MYSVIHANGLVYPNIYFVSKLKVLLNNINTADTECIRRLYPCMFPKTNRRKGCYPVPQQHPIYTHTHNYVHHTAPCYILLMFLRIYITILSLHSSHVCISKLFSPLFIFSGLRLSHTNPTYLMPGYFFISQRTLLP